MAFKMTGPWLKSALKHKLGDASAHPGPGKEGDEGYHAGHQQGKRMEMKAQEVPPQTTKEKQIAEVNRMLKDPYYASEKHQESLNALLAKLEKEK